MAQKKIILITEAETQNTDDLFAVHSPSEGFFLAYQINKTLGTQFKNATETIQPNSTVPFFSRFIWEQSPGDPQWELIANHYIASEKVIAEELLFSAAIEKKTSLIPNMSKVDYFLKVPKNLLNSTKMSALQALNEIQMVYPIHETKIKQNPNLIFD